MLKENRSVLYNSIKNFLIFVAFFLVVYFYQKTAIYDRLYALILVQSIVLVIYIISVFKIKIGLYLFIFLIPLLSTVSNMIGIRRMNVIFCFFLALFLGFLVNRLKSNNVFTYETELARPILIFMIILAISSLITIFRYSNFYPLITTKFHSLTVNFAGHNSIGAILWTLKYFFYYISGFGLLFIIFSILKRRKDFFLSLVILLSTSLIVVAAGFYQHFLNPYFGTNTFWIEANRINSTFTDPNSLGGYIILLFPLFISLIIFLKKWYLRLITGIFLIIFIYLSFLCGSRSAFFAMLVAILLFIIIGLSIALRHFIKKKVKEPRKNVLISVGIIVLLIIILFSSFMGILLKTEILDNIGELGGTGIILVDRVVDAIGDYYTSLKSEGFDRAFITISSGRDVLWRQAIYMYRDHPVSGVGQGAYFIELPDYHRRYHIGYHLYDFTGNYYLQILSELGLVGIILVLFIFFLIIKKSLSYFLNKNKNKQLQREDWLLAGLLISFFSMISVLFFGPHTNFIEIQFLFWLVIGLIITYININSRSKLLGENSKKYFSIGTFKQIRFDLISKIVLIFIIFIFGFTLLKSSAGDLSINIKQTLYGWENYYGYYQEETIEDQKIKWTGIDAIQVIEKRGEKLIVPVKDSDPSGHLLPLFIRFFIDNKLVKVVKIGDKEWHDIEIDLSDYSKEKFTFTISCSRSWVPKERGLSNDTRELGVMTGEFRFLE